MYIDTSDVNWIAIFTLILVLINAITFWSMSRQFKAKNVYDQWITALSSDFHKHHMKVDGLMKNQNGEEIKNWSNDDKETVNFVLDYWLIKASSIKYRIIDRELAMRMGYLQMIRYFEILYPWIEKQKQVDCYDLKWLYVECLAYRNRINIQQDSGCIKRFHLYCVWYCETVKRRLSMNRRNIDRKVKNVIPPCSLPCMESTPHQK